MTPAVLIYSQRPCGYCERAKALLRRRGLAFEEVDLTGLHSERMALTRRTGMLTVPQIFIDGELIGGFDELSQLDSSGRLSAPPEA